MNTKQSGLGSLLRCFFVVGIFVFVLLFVLFVLFACLFWSRRLGGGGGEWGGVDYFLR